MTTLQVSRAGKQPEFQLLDVLHRELQPIQEPLALGPETFAFL